MTFQGTITKLSYLIGIVSISALLSIFVSLDAIASGNASVVSGLTWGGMLGGVVVALILGFMRPENPATLMTVYAVLMGMFIGSISILFELAFEGIIIQAGLGTIFITVSMLGVYSSRLIRATPTFNKVIGCLVASIMMMYVVSLLFSLLTPFEVPYLHTSGPIGIAITAFILCVAALSLISDFGFIESGVKWNAPKNAEWWGAFGVLVTIIWIYIEMVRLLAKIRD